MASSAAKMAELVILEHLQVGTYVDIASTAMLCYDYLLTFKSETQFMWGQNFSIITALFMVTRYLPFMDNAVVLAHQLVPVLSSHQCSVLYQVSGWSFIIGIGVAEFILILRTWAIWNRQNRVLAILVAVFIAAWIPMMYCLARFLSSLKFVPLPAPQLAGCFVAEASSILFITYLIITLFETFIFGLTIYKAVQSFRVSSMGMYRTLYRDGLLFYFYVFAFSVTNIIVLAAAPKEFSVLLTLAHRNVHAMLSGRILLNLRAAAKAPPVNGTGISMSQSYTAVELETLKFAT